MPHSSRQTFDAHEAPKGPLGDAGLFLFGQTASLREDHDAEDLTFLDSFPCPEAPPEQATSKKRALPGDMELTRFEGSPAKEKMVDDDELELLHPSTGAAAAAEYELIGGRFVKVRAPSTLPAEEASCILGFGVYGVAQPRPDFDELLLSKEGWRIWAESSGGADPKTFAGWKPRSRRLPYPRTAMFSWVPRSRKLSYKWP